MKQKDDSNLQSPLTFSSFRFVEVFAAMAPHMALSSRAARRQSLRRLSAASPVFVFFLGYAIVVALLAKFDHNTRSSGAANAETEIHEELSSNIAAELQPSPEKAIVFQDKKIICEEVAKLKAPKSSPVGLDILDIDA